MSSVLCLRTRATISVACVAHTRGFRSGILPNHQSFLDGLIVTDMLIGSARLTQALSGDVVPLIERILLRVGLVARSRALDGSCHHFGE